MSDSAINKLIDEYNAWNRAQGLALGSADEHLFDEDLTDDQRRWLADFCKRWEAADRAPATVSERGLNHNDCQYSTNIADAITAGQGKLDALGDFAIPCPDCAARMAAICGNTGK